MNYDKYQTNSMHIKFIGLVCTIGRYKFQCLFRKVSVAHAELISTFGQKAVSNYTNHSKMVEFNCATECKQSSAAIQFLRKPEKNEKSSKESINKRIEFIVGFLLIQSIFCIIFSFWWRSKTMKIKPKNRLFESISPSLV